MEDGFLNGFVLISLIIRPPFGLLDHSWRAGNNFLGPAGSYEGRKVEASDPVLRIPLVGGKGYKDTSQLEMHSDTKLIIKYLSR